MRESQVRALSGTQKFSKTERLLPKNGYFCSEKLKQAPLTQRKSSWLTSKRSVVRIHQGAQQGSIGRVLLVSVKHRLGGSIPSAPTTKGSEA